MLIGEVSSKFPKCFFCGLPTGCERQDREGAAGRTNRETAGERREGCGEG